MITVIEKQYMESVISINRMMRKAQETGPDWEQRRYEIAKDAICAYLTNGPLEDEDLETCCELAVNTADTLIAKLQKVNTNGQDNA